MANELIQLAEDVEMRLDTRFLSLRRTNWAIRQQYRSGIADLSEGNESLDGTCALIDL